jgi:hypothetical protein
MIVISFLLANDACGVGDQEDEKDGAEAEAGAAAVAPTAVAVVTSAASE